MSQTGGEVQFRISTPDVDLKAHIDHALSLNLPEADASQKTLHLIANGPSAKAYFERLAQWHHSPEVLLADTMAVNGALELFTGQHLFPTYWIACDPQGPSKTLTTALDFLKTTPPETTYLVASKCHPKVFDRLKDRNVRIWHVSDHPVPGRRNVPCAVSVTICAILLAQRMGYRRIETWGWDCCFEGETHHAGQGDLSSTPDELDIEVGEGEEAVWFKSNPTWCCEVQDAERIWPMVKWLGTEVIIHGHSMVGEILNESHHG